MCLILRSIGDPVKLNQTHIKKRLTFRCIKHLSCLPASNKETFWYCQPSSKTTLLSSVIEKSKLLRCDTVLDRYSKLKNESRIGTLAVKLAREVFFGEDVLRKCTVAGCRDLPGLPTKEVGDLKQLMFRQFPAYWNSPATFEPLWTTCVNSINQCCKVLQRSTKL